MRLFGVAVLMITVLGSALAKAEGIETYISELKGGVFLHDVWRENPGKDIEENTVDINAEILFSRLTFIDSGNRYLNILLQPRPHIGGAVNTEGWTHHGYFGLTWDYQLEAGPFIEFAFGLAVHDGQLKRPAGGDTDRPNLGSRVLFREGLDIGWRFGGGHSLALHGSHLSHGGLFAKENDGMNFVGLRYGLRL